MLPAASSDHDLADAADRLQDRDHPEYGDAAQHQDHEQAHEEVDPVDARGLGVGLALALLGGGDQSCGRIPDQHGHRIADLAGARNLAHGVAIVPGGGRELFDDAGIVRQQLRQLFEALLVRGVVGEFERGLDPPRGFLRVGRSRSSA